MRGVTFFESGIRKILYAQDARRERARPACCKNDTPIGVESGREKAPAERVVVSFALRRKSWSCQEGGEAPWREYGMPYYRSKPAGPYKCAVGHAGERVGQDYDPLGGLDEKIQEISEFADTGPPGFYAVLAYRPLSL